MFVDFCCHDNGKTAWLGRAPLNASVAWTRAFGRWRGVDAENSCFWAQKAPVARILGAWTRAWRGKAQFSSSLRFLAVQQGAGSSRSSFSLSLAPAADTSRSFKAMSFAASTAVSSMPSPSLSPYIDAAIRQRDFDSDDDCLDDVIQNTGRRIKKRKIVDDDSDVEECSQPQPEFLDFLGKSILSHVSSDGDSSDVDHDDEYLSDDSDDNESTVAPQSPPYSPGRHNELVTGLTSLREPEIEAWDNSIRDHFRTNLTKLLDADILTSIVETKRKSSNLDGADSEADNDDDSASVIMVSDDEVENQQGLESDSPKSFPFELTVKTALKDYKIYLFNRPQQQSVVRVHDGPYGHYKIDISPDETVVDGITQITAFGRCLEDPSRSSRDYECPNGSAQIDNVNRGALKAMSLLNDYKSHHSDDVSDKDKAIFRSVVELLKQTDMVKPFSDYACFSQRFEF